MQKRIRVHPWNPCSVWLQPLFFYGVIYPNLFVVATSLQRAGAWTLANYREVLSQRIVIEAIVSSLGLSVLTVFVLRARRRAARVSF